MKGTYSEGVLSHLNFFTGLWDQSCTTHTNVIHISLDAQYTGYPTGWGLSGRNGRERSPNLNTCISDGPQKWEHSYFPLIYVTIPENFVPSHSNIRIKSPFQFNFAFKIAHYLRLLSPNTQSVVSPKTFPTWLNQVALGFLSLAPSWIWVKPILTTACSNEASRILKVSLVMKRETAGFGFGGRMEALLAPDSLQT